MTAPMAPAKLSGPVEDWPPSERWTAVAQLDVAEPGPVSAGLPLAAEQAKRITAVRLRGADAAYVPGQADNSSTDLDGWVRFVQLSALMDKPGRYTIEVMSGPDDMAICADVPNPPPSVAIELDGSPVDLSSARLRGLWRRGAIVTEAVWDVALGQRGLRALILETRWADGRGRSTVIVENGASRPGEVAASTLTYAITLTRGAQRMAYTNVQHVPYARWLRRLGTPDVFAEVLSVGGGSTWDHFKQSRMLQNFAQSPGPPSMAPLAALPDAPFAVNDAQTILHFSRGQGAPGANPDIGPHPAYYLAALRNFSPDMLRVIGANADARMGAAVFFRNVATGTFHRPDEGPEYVGDGRWSGTKIGLRQREDRAGPNQGWAHSHWGAMFYIPYLVTGRFEYLEGQVAQQFFSWVFSPWENCGRQLNRHPLNFTGNYTEVFVGGQERPQLRSQGWAARTTVHTQALLPDDDARIRPLLGWDKTVTRTLWRNVCANLKRLYIDANTGPGKRFNEDGAHFIVDDVRGKQWQIGMLITSLAHGVEIGALPPEGMAFFRWIAATHIGVSGLDHPYRDRMVGCDNWYKRFPDGRPARTILELYEASIAHGPDVFGSLESDWAGYHYAIASYAVNNRLPGAAAARGYARTRWPNGHSLNHYIEPR